MKTIIGFMCLVSVLWGGWPLVVRSAGIDKPGPLDNLIISFSAFLPVLMFTVWKRQFELPEPGATTRFGIAGLMMGIGLLSYNRVTSSNLIDISTSIPLINSGMLLVTVA